MKRLDWINALLQDPAVAVAEPSPLESTYGNYRARPARWVGQLHGSFAAVATILKAGEPIGSGCAVRSRGLGLPFDEIVVVTDAHVVCDPTLPGATPGLFSQSPDLMQIAFDERLPRQVYGCEVIWQSPLSRLDVAVLRPTPAHIYDPVYPFEIPALPIAGSEPDEWLALPQGGGRRRQRFFVLAHPATVTLEDNMFLGPSQRKGESFPNFLHYECPTTPGASGAGVLNEALELVAVHRAGAATLADGRSRDLAKPNRNEGVSIQSVRTEIALTFSGQVPARRQPFWSRFRKPVVKTSV